MAFSVFITSVFSAIAWPAAIVLIFYWFRGPLEAVLWKLADRRNGDDGDVDKTPRSGG
jgi:hypothetical protein